MPRNPRLKTVLLLALAIAGTCILAILAMPAYLTIICRDPQYPNLSDPTPLVEAPFIQRPLHPQDFIDVSVFDTYQVIERPDSGGYMWLNGRLDRWPNGNLPAWDRIYVDVSFHPSLSWARLDYDFRCTQDRERVYPIFSEGGQLDNRYCLTYIVQSRYSTDSFCALTGQYTSSATFQKGVAVIEISEYTSDRSSHVLQDAILLVARAMSVKSR